LPRRALRRNARNRGADLRDRLSPRGPACVSAGLLVEAGDRVPRALRSGTLRSVPSGRGPPRGRGRVISPVLLTPICRASSSATSAKRASPAPPISRTGTAPSPGPLRWSPGLLASRWERLSLGCSRTLPFREGYNPRMGRAGQERLDGRPDHPGAKEVVGSGNGAGALTRANARGRPSQRGAARRMRSASCGAKLPEPSCRRRMGSARAAPPGPEEARETEAPRALARPSTPSSTCSRPAASDAFSSS